ncbi:hypothetical protein ABZ069_34115 [Streptomyces microflavus]
MSDQPQPDSIIVTDRALTPVEAEELRQHVTQRGLVGLPFGAKVKTPGA